METVKVEINKGWFNTPGDGKSSCENFTTNIITKTDIEAQY